jgi:tRNA-modifying protein YgfZ
MVSLETYRGARTRAALIDRSERDRIVLTGAERASYLHGVLTNDITALKPGDGCYAAYLSPQGRMLTDLFVYELGDRMLVTVPRQQKASILARLDQLIFSEDVQLSDVTTALTAVAIVGPESAQVLGSVIGERPEMFRALPLHGHREVSLSEGTAVVIRIDDTGEPGYDIFLANPHADMLRRAFTDAGVPEADADTADLLRIEAGVPVFNRDMDEETIPLEAGIESRAISFTKGCYVGQEVIVRILHRGHGRVARKLVGLTVEGEAIPRRGDSIRADDRDIGQVTSATRSPALNQPIALGYVHRDFISAGTTVAVGGQRATVTMLPFVSVGAVS